MADSTVSDEGNGRSPKKAWVGIRWRHGLIRSGKYRMLNSTARQLVPLLEDLADNDSAELQCFIPNLAAGSGLSVSSVRLGLNILHRLRIVDSDPRERKRVGSNNKIKVRLLIDEKPDGGWPKFGYRDKGMSATVCADIPPISATSCADTCAKDEGNCAGNGQNQRNQLRTILSEDSSSSLPPPPTAEAVCKYLLDCQVKPDEALKLSRLPHVTMRLCSDTWNDVLRDTTIVNQASVLAHRLKVDRRPPQAKPLDKAIEYKF